MEREKADVEKDEMKWREQRGEAGERKAEVGQDQTWDWGKVKKEENDAGDLAPPEAEGFFCMSSQKKKSILAHENQIFASQQALCLDQTFTWLFSKLHWNWKCHSGAQKIRY